MPDPIIDPTTIAVALKSPRLATSPVFWLAGFSTEGADVAEGVLTCPSVLLENFEKVSCGLRWLAAGSKNRGNHRD